MIDTMVCTVERIFEHSVLSDVLIAIFGSAIGTGCGFAFSVFYMNRKEKNTNKQELIKYFYNLRTALRNLATLSNNIEVVFKILREKKEIVALPTSLIDFNFNETKLGFIQKYHSVFYETINQLKIEIRTLHDLILLVNEEKKEFYLYNARTKLITVLIQLMEHMRTVDNFLTVHGDMNTLFDKDINQNFDAALNFIHSYETLLQNRLENTSSMSEKEIIKSELKNIKDTFIGWSIKFDAKKAWYSRFLGIFRRNHDK